MYTADLLTIMNIGQMVSGAKLLLGWGIVLFDVSYSLTGLTLA